MDELIDQEETQICPACQYGKGHEMGYLGNTMWYRCRDCDWKFKQEDTTTCSGYLNPRHKTHNLS